MIIELSTVPKNWPAQSWASQCKGAPIAPVLICKAKARKKRPCVNLWFGEFTFGETASGKPIAVYVAEINQQIAIQVI